MGPSCRSVQGTPTGFPTFLPQSQDLHSRLQLPARASVDSSQARAHTVPMQATNGVHLGQLERLASQCKSEMDTVSVQRGGSDTVQMGSGALGTVSGQHGRPAHCARRAAASHTSLHGLLHQPAVNPPADLTWNCQSWPTDRMAGRQLLNKGCTTSQLSPLYPLVTTYLMVLSGSCRHQ